MYSPTTPSRPDSNELPQPVELRELFEWGARFDRCGRRIERYLLLQLDRLERAIEEFEQMRDAWEQQRDRELTEWQQRPRGGGQASGTDPSGRPRGALARALTPPGVTGGPLRLWLHRGAASSMQLGLLMFEISKLNREVGGEGVRFEVRSCRRVRSRLRFLSPAGEDETSIVEFEIFSVAPVLHAPADHADEMQTEAALRCWEQFQYLLLMSTLADDRLEVEYRKGTELPREAESCQHAIEAARRANHANVQCDREDAPYGPCYRPRGDFDAVRQQLRRLENVTACLSEECGLRLQFGLISPAPRSES